MKVRRKSAARNTQDGAHKGPAAKNFASHPLQLTYVADLIEYGEISIGILRPIGCVASASDEDRTLAMLVRRKGENLTQLLIRLDLAIAKAYDEGILTDEINS